MARAIATRALAVAVLSQHEPSLPPLQHDSRGSLSWSVRFPPRATLQAVVANDTRHCH